MTATADALYDEAATPLSPKAEEPECAQADPPAPSTRWGRRAVPLVAASAALLLFGVAAIFGTTSAAMRSRASFVPTFFDPVEAGAGAGAVAADQQRENHDAGGIVQLFGDMAARAPLGADGKPVPQREEIRKLIEQDFEWEDEPEGALQCSIDVVQATAYLGQAVVFLYKAAEFCPTGDEVACGVSVSIVLTSFAWIASYLSLAAESCREALELQFISLDAICAADVTGLVANLLEIITVSQAVGTDCDFGPEGPWEQWQHNGSAVMDLIHKVHHDEDASVSKVLKREYEKLGLVKKSENSEKSKLFSNWVGPMGFHSKVFSLRALRKQFHTRKGHSWWPGYEHKSAPEPLGRRLGEHDGTVSEFLEKAKEAREAKLLRNQEKMARDYDIAQCVFDVTQSVSYIVRATFQIHSAVENCPDPTACSVDILNIISSFAWITQFTSLAVGDCAVESFQKAYCSGDISDMIAAVTNGAAIGIAIPTDCAKQ